MNATASLRNARTGPIGRLARIALLAVLSGAWFSLVDEGGAKGLRGSSILGEPVLVLATLVMVVLFVRLAGEVTRALWNERAAGRAQRVAFGGVAAVLVGAAAIGQVAFGRVWGMPLVDVVWWFDVITLGQTIVALPLAIGLGTPGCEIGVWTELIDRARSERRPSASPVLCVIGLDVVDEWESRRRRRAAGGEVTCRRR